MMAFSLNEAWNEGVAFVRNNLRMVVIWAAIGALIPAIMSFAIMGGIAQQQAMMQQIMAGGDPSAMLAAMGGGVFLVSMISQVITTASYFGAWRMGLARDVVAAPQAGIYAFGASLLSLLFFLITGILLVLVLAIPLGLLGVLGAAAGGESGGPAGILAAVGIGLLLFLLLVPLILWLSARLSVYGPAMAAAGSINPLYGVAQSWRLTKPAQWSILGYIVLLIIAIIVVSMVIGLISGVGMLATGGLQSGGLGTGTLIFTTIVGMVVAVPMAVAYIGIPAGIYRALRPDPVSDVFS